MAQYFDRVCFNLQTVIENIGKSNQPKESEPMTTGEFKSKHAFEKRVAEAGRIVSKYPDRTPVIVEKSKEPSCPSIDKQKYLVPCDLTVGQFVYVIRKRLKLKPEQAIFLFINNSLAPTSTLMSELYKEHGRRNGPMDTGRDGFLYITYSLENTFG